MVIQLAEQQAREIVKLRFIQCPLEYQFHKGKMRKIILSTILLLVFSGCSSISSAGDSAYNPANFTQAEVELYKDARDRLISNPDPIEGITRYRDSRAQQYVDSKSAIVPYIVQSDGEQPEVLIRFQYVGYSWIFWQTLIFAIDDQRKTVEYSYSDVDRDNGGRKVWEDHTIFATGDDLKMLEDMANSSSTTIRFKGDEGSEDLVLTEEDKAMIQNTLDAYKWLLWDFENN